MDNVRGIAFNGRIGCSEHVYRLTKKRAPEFDTGHYFTKDQRQLRLKNLWI